jgi:hypothetical protein
MYTIIIPIKEAVKLMDLRTAWDFLPYPSQPWASAHDEYRIYIKEHIHSWFLEQNIFYSLRIKDDNTVRITFDEKTDATLFKLTWMKL